LGVRNFHMEFLPSHLHHLGGLLNKQSNNPFFPLSIVLASTVTLFLFYKAIQPDATDAQTTGSLLVATMIALGIIEHLLLVLPIPATLYGWGIRPLPPLPGADDDMQRPPHATLRVIPQQMIEIEG
jgi:putative photosynthetic complex assembly protein 2